MTIKTLHIRHTDKLLTEVPKIPDDVEGLYLFGNKLSSFPTLNLYRLSILHLQENLLTFVDLSKYPLLSKVYLDNNSLSSLVLPPNIEELSLANQRTPLDLDFFRHSYVPRLRFLDVSGCELSDLSLLSHISSLETLIARQNLISNLEGIIPLSDLKIIELDLSLNPVQMRYRHYKEEVIFLMKRLISLDGNLITEREREISESLVVHRFRSRKKV
ncbi:hypothetical protein RCL1_007553 [Eukaryota sp. TZLM3-RCL]